MRFFARTGLRRGRSFAWLPIRISGENYTVWLEWYEWRDYYYEVGGSWGVIRYLDGTMPKETSNK